MSDVSSPIAPSDHACLADYVATRSSSAFALLVERHLGTVRGTCVDMLGYRHAYVDDACQAVFLILARRAPEITTPQALAAWLRSTARGVCANIRRAERRRSQREGSWSVPSESLAVAAPAVDQDTEAQTRSAAQLELAISSLSPRQREAVIHHFFLGKRQALIAQELGVSEGAVKKRISDAMASLRTFFGQREQAMPSLLAALSLSQQDHTRELLNACAATASGHGRPPVERLAATSTRPLGLGITIGAGLAACGVLLGLLAMRSLGAAAAPPASSTVLVSAEPWAGASERQQLADALLAPIRALRQNDLSALLAALPPSSQQAIAQRWTAFAATPSPIGDQLANAGLAWARSPGARPMMSVLYRPLTSDLQNALATLSDGERRAGYPNLAHVLTAIRYDLAADTAGMDLYAPERVRAVAEHTRATVSVWHFSSVQQFRQAPWSDVVHTFGLALASIKRWWMPYGLQVDGVLDSFRVVSITGSRSDPLVGVAFTACDHQHLVWVQMHRTAAGAWSCPALEDLLSHSFEQVSHYFYLPDRHRALAPATVDAPLPISRPPDDLPPPAPAVPVVVPASPRGDG